MNRPVRTTTPSGEEIVILSAAKYDRLLELAEDMRDIAVAEKDLSDFEAGRGEALTASEMRELLEAATPLVFWRKRRRLTQSALAGVAGISQAYVGQIEQGKRVGDVRLYRRLAGALGVAIEDLLPPERVPARGNRRSAAKRRRK